MDRGVWGLKGWMIKRIQCTDDRVLVHIADGIPPSHVCTSMLNGIWCYDFGVRCTEGMVVCSSLVWAVLDLLYPKSLP